MGVRVDDNEDGDDGEVRSHSGSGSRLRLSTDYHHVPDAAVTYQRNKKKGSVLEDDITVRSSQVFKNAE